jgi:hypothetical protein
MLLYISFLPTAKAWNLSGLFSFDYILTNLFQTILICIKILKKNTNYSAICAFTTYLKVYILYCRICIKLIRKQCVKVGTALSNWEQMAFRRSLFSDQYVLAYF